MLKPLVTQVWPQFTADEQFTASFSNVFVERVELFRSARKVIICLRSTEPLDSALCGRLLASLEQIFAGYELTMRNYFNYNAITPEAVKAMIEELKALSVLELSELVKAVEEEFGVSATPVAVAGGAAAGDGAAAAEAKTDFDVVLVDAGSSKIGVIKVVREITGLGLKEAKEKVDTAPQTIKEAAPEAEANEIKEKLEAAGAKVELK